MNPCKDCNHRDVGCHGKCEDYKAFRVKLIESKQNYKRNNAMIYLDQHYLDRIRKIKLNQGKRLDY